MVDHKNEEPKTPLEHGETVRDQENLDDFELEENDPMLASLSQLPKIHVPSTFLPNVMYRVYEKHHRDKISLPFVMISSLLLLAAALVAMVLDVHRYQDLEGLSTFGEAFGTRMTQFSNNFSSSMSSVATFLDICWNFVSAAVAALIAGNASLNLVILVVVVIALPFIIKKVMTGVLGK